MKGAHSRLPNSGTPRSNQFLGLTYRMCIATCDLPGTYYTPRGDTSWFGSPHLHDPRVRDIGTRARAHTHLHTHARVKDECDMMCGVDLDTSTLPAKYASRILSNGCHPAGPGTAPVPGSFFLHFFFFSLRSVLDGRRGDAPVRSHTRAVAVFTLGPRPDRSRTPAPPHSAPPHPAPPRVPSPFQLA